PPPGITGWRALVALRFVAQRARRNRRRRARARSALALPGVARGRARRGLRRARSQLLALARIRRARSRRVSLRPDAGEPDPPAGGCAIGAAGVVPAPERGSGGDRGTRGNAPARAEGARAPSAVESDRQRPAPPAALVVQPRLSAAGENRLAHARDRAGKADAVRGGPRNPGLGRPQAAP